MKKRSNKRGYRDRQCRSQKYVSLNLIGIVLIAFNLYVSLSLFRFNSSLSLLTSFFLVFFFFSPPLSHKELSEGSVPARELSERAKKV